MVRYDVADDYFFKYVNFMNGLRHTNTLCDVSLQVGQSSIPAHRCVLAAASPYFNTLLLGSFSDPPTQEPKEVNLQNVTNDYFTMELIVNFIYTGSINIQEENVDAIINLASFFLIQPLFDLCVSFVANTLCLQNCLKYYKIANDHQMTAIGKKVGSLVKARFHDVLMHQEDTHRVFPSTLLNLYEFGAFQHCPPRDLFRFIMLWVWKGMTTLHMRVGLEILNSPSHFLDKTCQQLVPTGEGYIDIAYKMIDRDSRDARVFGRDRFLSRVKHLIARYSPEDELPILNNEIAAGELQNSNSPSAATDADLEDVIVTISSEMKYIGPDKEAEDPKSEHDGKADDPEREHDGKAGWNICAYAPRTKSWFWICKANGDPEEDLTAVTDLETSIDWTISTEDGNNIVITNGSLENIESFDVTRQEGVIWSNWSPLKENRPDSTTNRLQQVHLTATDVFEIEADDEDVTEVCYSIIEGNGVEYRISVHRIIQRRNGQENKTVFFRGSKYDESGQMWTRGFETSAYVWALPVGRLIATVSTVSNELMVAYIEEEKHGIYLVVDLNKEPQEPVTLWLPTQSPESDVEYFGLINIIPDKHHFFVISDEKRENGRKVTRLLFEYKYNTNKIKEHSTHVEYVETNLWNFEDGTNQRRDYLQSPDLEEFVFVDRGSVWNLATDRGVVSSLLEIGVSPDRHPVITLHSPPPISGLKYIYIGKASITLLEKLGPVSLMKYLDMPLKEMLLSAEPYMEFQKGTRNTLRRFLDADFSMRYIFEYLVKELAKDPHVTP